MSEKAKAHYKLNKRIKDDTFSVDHISEYNLSLQVSKSVFRICITDSEKNRCMFLEDYSFQNVKTFEELIDQLQHIYDDHHILQAGFWKTIKLAIKNTRFSLVPEALFDKDHLQQYLAINAGIRADEDGIYYYKQSGVGAINIFSADRNLLDWFSGLYPNKAIKLVHDTSPLIEGIMVAGKHQQGERVVYIHVENNYFTLLVKNNKTLEFCNTFNFDSVEDFVYYVMFVMEELNLNPETVTVIISGEISQDSPIYNKLFKYIRKISFGTKPASLYFGYNFDEIFDHRFFDLYNMHLCE